MERAYTVKELDALRETVRRKIEWGTYGQPGPMASGFCQAQPTLAVRVEEQVRTHMLAGHTAEDLIASEVPEAGI